MGSVFAAAVAFPDEVCLVELVVTVGVFQAPEALVGHLVDHHVEAVEGVKQAVGTAGGLAVGHVERFHLERVALAGGGQRDPIDLAVLVAGDEAALVVLGDGDP